MSSTIIIGVIAATTLIVIIAFGVKVVRPNEEGLIERFGKFRKKAPQGFHWIIPMIDRMTHINITEQMVDVPPQQVITKDDLNAEVDAVVYFKVQDTYKAIYKADDVERQIASLARTTLRQLIGTMGLSEANSERARMNEDLEVALDKQTDAWGIEIVRVEIQRIEPPKDVQESMNNVVKAEREKKAAVDFANAVETKADGDRRAAIKQAEGNRQGYILAAEGTKQAAVLNAEGTKQAKILLAEGEAKAIKEVNESLRAHFKDNAIKYKQYETVTESLANNSKIVVTKDGIDPVLVLGDDGKQQVVPINIPSISDTIRTKKLRR